MTDVDTTAPAPDATWRPRHNPWLIAATVTLAAFMEILDTTIVNVACIISPATWQCRTMMPPGH
jgi:MFS transporter, DHA2 family, multidrug resistance protein